MTKNDLKVTRPLSIWNRTVKFDFKELFITLTKSTISFFSHEPIKGVKDLVDLVKAVKLEDDIPGNAYKLILTALINAAYDIVDENKVSINIAPTKKIYDDQRFVQFLKKIEQKLSEVELTIDHNFFKNPAISPAFVEFKELFGEILLLLGFDKNQASNLTERFNSFFVFSLNDEWRRHHEYYESLYKDLQTPFTDISQKYVEWATYNAYLTKQVNESVFGESFGLSDIYVPLRGYYENTQVKSGKTNRVVINVDDYIINCINRKVKDLDQLKIVSGGPGSGKSSAAKILANRIVNETSAYALFIPLQHFNVKEDLISGLDDYLSIQGILSFNPLKGIKDLDKTLVIIFDGLDELSKQGKFANEVANQFIGEIVRYLNLINNASVKLQIIITGREVSVQTQAHQFRAVESIIHLLPYFVTQESGDSYKDPKGLLGIDQRKVWWARYISATGKLPKQFPKQLQSVKYGEITSQPLLCYLVALSFFRKKINFSKVINLNEVYGDLIKSVFSRKYEPNVHTSLKELNFTEEVFFRILEEIAITAWHSGDIRTTTVGEINKHIEQNNLSSFFENFQKNAESGIMRLLTAFYFRQKSIDVNQNKTFEFTHKSFGEYLVSRRVISLVQLISKKVEENKSNPDDGIDILDALVKLGSVVGYNNFDHYLYSFIANEIDLFDKDIVEVWHKNLVSMLNLSLSKGVPVEKISANSSYKEMCNLSRNVEEALLILVYLTSLKVGKQFEISWPNEFSLSDMLSRLSIKRNYYSNGESRKYHLLCYTVLGNQIIQRQNLASRSLTHANFQDCRLTDVVFAGADLFGADFRNSQIVECNFYRSNLQRVMWEGVSFTLQKKKGLLTFEQLCQAKSLKNCKGIPLELPSKLEASLGRKYKDLRNGESSSHLHHSEISTPIN